MEVAASVHPASGPVLVCFAVREESRFFKAPAKPATDVLITGIGLHNTARALASYLSSRQPRLVLTCGFAGGLNPTHSLGQLIFDATDATEFQHQIEAVGALPGRFAHSDRVVVTAAEKARLFKATAADAVEMESSAIVGVCRERGIPVIVLRVISDAAGEDLPLDFNRYSRADGSLSLPRLLAGIARSPGVIPELVRFQGRLTRAADGLGMTLQRFLALGNLF